MGVHSDVHMATGPPSPGPLLHGLPDVASLGYTLSDMGHQERRRYLAANRLDRILSRSTLCEETQSQPDFDFAGVWAAHRDRWNRPGVADGLRILYNHNRRAYFRDFRCKQEVIDTILECGMQTFTMITQRLERAALRKDFMRPYVAAGKSALEAFGDSLAESSLSPNEAADVIFISIDFEGGHNDRGVTGFGATKFDTRSFLTSDHPELQAENFRLRSKSKQNFMFGSTTRVDGDEAARTVVDTITATSDGAQRKIVLVGQGILVHEMTILRKMGISIEELPVVGVIDTALLANEVLGQSGSLESLLQYFQIDYTRSSLHCAGNDAYYTMQVLLALLERSHFVANPDSPRTGFVKVMDVVKRLVPKVHCGPRRLEGGLEEKVEESDDHSSEDRGGLEGGDLGALFG